MRLDISSIEASFGQHLFFLWPLCIVVGASTVEEQGRQSKNALVVACRYSTLSTCGLMALSVGCRTNHTQLCLWPGNEDNFVTSSSSENYVSNGIETSQFRVLWIFQNAFLFSIVKQEGYSRKSRNIQLEQILWRQDSNPSA